MAVVTPGIDGGLAAVLYCSVVTQPFRSFRYWLSWVLPVPMQSTYGVFDNPSWAGEVPQNVEPDRWEHTSWWQWCGRVGFVRTHPALGP